VVQSQSDVGGMLDKQLVPFIVDLEIANIIGSLHGKCAIKIEIIFQTLRFTFQCANNIDAIDRNRLCTSFSIHLTLVA
jgi:hypothetical protein